jgi:hypothetical protein
MGVMISITTSFGQEGNLPVTGEEQEQPVVTPNTLPSEEGLQLWEDQSNEVTEAYTEKKSPSATTVTAATPGGENEQNVQATGNDSVISFNFLYYLFQKFKLSENVE